MCAVESSRCTRYTSHALRAPSNFEHAKQKSLYDHQAYHMQKVHGKCIVQTLPCSYSLMSFVNKTFNFLSLAWELSSSPLSSSSMKLTRRIDTQPRPNALILTAEFSISSRASCSVSGYFSAAAYAALRC